VRISYGASQNPGSNAEGANKATGKSCRRRSEGRLRPARGARGILLRPRERLGTKPIRVDRVGPRMIWDCYLIRQVRKYFCNMPSGASWHHRPRRHSRSGDMSGSDAEGRSYGPRTHRATEARTEPGDEGTQRTWPSPELAPLVAAELLGGQERLPLAPVWPQARESQMFSTVPCP
jgi:hypothetical protein